MINIRNQVLLDSFAKALKMHRKSKGFTQEELALRTDISLSQIARIETGKINPTLCTLDIIAKGLELSLEDLFKEI